MKIAFLNSSLEPGRDGVGDYTRLLAEECRRQGHECCTIAIHDQYVSEPQSDSPTHLRLPAMLSWSERIKIAQQRLTDFAPDWVSLQFVPYAFHPKGLVHGLGNRLLPLMHGRKVHIMFHELWLGSVPGWPIKKRIIGCLQRVLVLKLITQINPACVHTSNTSYRNTLRKYSVQANTLPLFSNIPIVEEKGEEWLFSELRKFDINIDAANRPSFWLGGFFGNLSSKWSSEPLFTTLYQASIVRDRLPILISVGNLGPGKVLWEILSKQYGTKFRFIALGRQPQNRISHFLTSLDFGIATTPTELLGKSGTFAAMMEHGLPVIVNEPATYSISLPNESQPSLLHLMNDTLLSDLVADLPRGVPTSCLPHVTDMLVHSLTRYN